MTKKTVAALTATALAIGLLPLTGAEAAERITRESVTIPMEGGWSAKGELSYPKGAKGRLPVVVLLHGSGHNDMDQTIAPGAATFKTVAQAVNKSGFAVLRFHKRGVIGVGPQLSDDPRFVDFPKPYEQTVRDAAAVIRFAGVSKRIDPSKVFLLGHSEGTQVAGNLIADTRKYGINEPAGIVAMGVVGGDSRSIIYYQVVGRTLGQLHEEFDFDGDGDLTPAETADGLIGLPDAVAAQLRAVLTDPATDTDGNGVLTIDTEVEPVVRAAIGFDNYPHLTGAPPSLAAYLADFGRFRNARQDLPKFGGPVLLLNGQSDIQTVVRGAIATDAALAAAGNRDHTLITYPGVGHLMNVTPKYQPEPGNPDQRVLRDITTWLAAHR